MLETAIRLLIGAAVALGGCKGEAEPAPAKASQPAAPAQIQWLKDDWPAAKKQAAAAGKPVVIDYWAKWCHTCLSMKHYVLTERSITELADGFVWLAVDTDRAGSDELQAKFEVAAWPTFYVIDAAREEVHARLVGSATAAEFRDFLERGLRSYEAAGSGSASLRSMRTGDRAAARGAWDEAAAAYRKAVELAGLGDTLPDVLVAWISTRYRAQDWQGCVELGLARLAEAAAGRSAKAADFAAYAHYCADHVAPELAMRLRRTVSAPDSPVRRVLDDPKAPLSVDDRSDGLRIVRDVLDSLGDKAAGRKLAERQRALLDEAVAKAPDAHAAMTFNWPLAEVYARLGRHAELIPRLKKSVEALPDEYDPPYRLAWLLLQAKRPAEALPWAKQALAKVYGPRKGRALGLLAEIYQAQGDAAAERKTRQQVVELYEALPATARNRQELERARKALGAVPSTAP